VMYGTNFHVASFVERTYTVFLGLEHRLLALEINEFYGLFCCMWGCYTFICFKVTVHRGRICCVCVMKQIACVPCNFQVSHPHCVV
jgi:hypothetical protein